MSNFQIVTKCIFLLRKQDFVMMNCYELLMFFILITKINKGYETRLTVTGKNFLFVSQLIRVSQICIFLSNLKIDVYHNFFPLFRLKGLQKNKFWKILCIFWPGPSCSKFYYITHLCEKGQIKKFVFFKVF